MNQKKLCKSICKGLKIFWDSIEQEYTPYCSKFVSKMQSFENWFAPEENNERITYYIVLNSGNRNPSVGPYFFVTQTLIMVFNYINSDDSRTRKPKNLRENPTFWLPKLDPNQTFSTWLKLHNYFDMKENLRSVKNMQKINVFCQHLSGLG